MQRSNVWWELRHVIGKYRQVVASRVFSVSKTLDCYCQKRISFLDEDFHGQIWYLYVRCHDKVGAQTNGRKEKTTSDKYIALYGFGLCCVSRQQTNDFAAMLTVVLAGYRGLASR